MYTFVYNCRYLSLANNLHGSGIIPTPNIATLYARFTVKFVISPFPTYNVHCVVSQEHIPTRAASSYCHPMDSEFTIRSVFITIEGFLQLSPQTSTGSYSELNKLDSITIYALILHSIRSKERSSIHVVSFYR
jgi:hypothetical protein